MKKLTDKDIVILAEEQSKVWEGSRYYEDALRWNHVFWREGTEFLNLFRKLNLEFSLELACGHGRHSEYILDHFNDEITNLIMMDILQSNIEYCKNRIHSEKVTFIKNDGAHLNDMSDNYCTSIFCYDAMVHFDKEVVLSYLKETYRVLRFGGMGLFHHSNYSENPNTYFSQNPHARAFMSDTLFSNYAEQAGLKIVEQKIIRWDDPDLDCITLLSK